MSIQYLCDNVTSISGCDQTKRSTLSRMFSTWPASSDTRGESEPGQLPQILVRDL